MKLSSRFRCVVAFSLLAPLHGCANAADVAPTSAAPAQTQPTFTNRLAKERSPYLLQHAHNPVDWYPWGDEAFAKSKAENKPIFLSVGYATCHWCHVMEEESFANPAVAKLINDHFVPIKVDREERPDIDRVYMTFVQATTGQGGWPMTVFLTPDRLPFFGGTYFPPEDQGGMPGMKRLLPRVAEVWTKDPERVLNSATAIAKEIREATTLAPPKADAVDPAASKKAAEQLADEFDEKYGGFGEAPKFPQPVQLQFLFRHYARTGNVVARDQALQTLRSMAAGGMHDHLGGGFHRYSTDARWFLPHFEKMLYDQAQLASVYLDAYQITRDPFFADVAKDVLNYVLRDLTGSEGRFFSAEDADSPISVERPNDRAEGRFYVWSADQIRTVLGGDAAAVFLDYYGVRPDGNVEVDPRHEFIHLNVLFAARLIEDVARQAKKSVAETQQLLSEGRRKLLASRQTRPRPRLDDKTLVSWNGLMISALARAGPILGDATYSRAAAKAASFVRSKLYDPTTHTLTRRYRDGHAEIDGFLADYAFLIAGLIDLYEADQNIEWLKWAIDLQSRQNALFADAAGGFFETPEHDSLLVRMQEVADGAEPSANSVSAINLYRLGQMTDDAVLRGLADGTVKRFTDRLNSSPSSLPAMLVAHDFGTAKVKQVVLAGDPSKADTQAMLTAVYSRFVPDRIVLSADGGAGQAFLATKASFLKDMGQIGGRATAYVCEGRVCQLPTNDVSVMLKLLSAQAESSSQPSK